MGAGIVREDPAKRRQHAVAHAVAGGEQSNCLIERRMWLRSGRGGEDALGGTANLTAQLDKRADGCITGGLGSRER